MAMPLMECSTGMIFTESFSQVLTVFENPVLSCRTLCPSAAVAGLSLAPSSHVISLTDKWHSLPRSTCLRWSCAKTLVSGMLWEPAQCPGSESCNDCGSNAGELSFEARSRLAVFLHALSCIEKVKRLPGIDRFAMPSFRILNFIILSESESTESLLRASLNLMNEKLFTVSLTVSLFLSVPWIPKHSIPFHPRVLAKVYRYPGHSAKCCVFGFGPTKCCFCCEPWQWHRQDPRFFSICQAVLDRVLLWQVL